MGGTVPQNTGEKVAGSINSPKESLPWFETLASLASWNTRLAASPRSIRYLPLDGPSRKSKEKLPWSLALLALFLDPPQKGKCTASLLPAPCWAQSRKRLYSKPWGLPCGGEAVAGPERAPRGAWTRGTPELETESS